MNDAMVDAYMMSKRWATQGYSVFPAVNGVDVTGAMKEFVVSVHKGTEYAILVGHNKDVMDVDVFVFDEGGQLIAFDRRNLSRAGVKFRASFTGNVRVRIRVAQANCFGAWSCICLSRNSEDEDMQRLALKQVVPKVDLERHKETGAQRTNKR